MRISIHHLALIATSLALAAASSSSAATSTVNETTAVPSSSPSAATISSSVDDKRNLSGSIVGEAFKLKKGKNADVEVSNAPSVAEAAAAIKSEQTINDEQQKEAPMRIPDQDAQIGCPNIHGRYTPNLPMRRGKSTRSVINNAMEATELIKNAVESAIRQESASSKEEDGEAKTKVSASAAAAAAKSPDTPSVLSKVKDDAKDTEMKKDIYGGPNGPFGLTNLGVKEDQETNGGAILPGVPAGLGRVMAVPNQSIVAKMFDEIRSSTEASIATSAATSTMDSIRSVPTVDIPGFEPGKPLKIPGITSTAEEASSNGRPTTVNSTIVQTVMATVTVTTMPPDVAALKQAHSKWDFY